MYVLYYSLIGFKVISEKEVVVIVVCWIEIIIIIKI